MDEGQGAPRLLARKGEARPAMRPDNDNAAGNVDAVDAAIMLAAGRRAAVTLRLDPLRHMRLRIACALDGRSAQAILGEALDAHLTTMSGIDGHMERAMADGGEAARGRGTER
ncbi:hypothetical protein [Sphingomonas profundi]|uniref:hypothetical protein n=1 Tax=Alterirhizorhabdus profundi TaxID=2681549 RepID=UPI003BAF8DCB